MKKLFAAAVLAFASLGVFAAEAVESPVGTIPTVMFCGPAAQVGEALSAEGLVPVARGKDPRGDLILGHNESTETLVVVLHVKDSLCILSVAEEVVPY
jgi:hypothetical protein